MAPTPERIWGLVSDVTRIGEYSPETFEAEWLDGATGRLSACGSGPREAQRQEGPDVLVVVHDHRVRARAGLRVRRRPDREEALNTWRYELVATGDGTDVTSRSS